MSKQNNGGADQNAPKGGMGLERFLQKFPQQSGLTTLLRLKHKADVKTLTEWEALVKEFLKTKVQ